MRALPINRAQRGLIVLDELRISGLGVIGEAALPLGPGLTVVTGETGAGKTMVVTGLLLLFGGRADAARVRAGADQAIVDGRLSLPAGSVAIERVRDAGGALDEDDGLVLRRVVSAVGRSRAYVGGAPAPVAVLGELADELLAVHGQADQLRLVRPGAQRAALDRYAGIDLSDFSTAYRHWRAAVAEWNDRRSRAAELRRAADLLTHGVAEIEAADPQPGELAELGQLAARLAAADALTSAARTAYTALLGDPDDPLAEGRDVASLLGATGHALTAVAGADPELDALTARVAELSTLANELGADLRRYVDGVDADPARLEQVETRRAVLTGLVRKYCDDPEPTLDAVLRWADEARDRLATLDVSDEALTALRAAAAAAGDDVARQAGEISARRRAAAERLGAAVSAELAGLAMPDAALEITVAPRPTSAGQPTVAIDGDEVAVGVDGTDEVMFLLRPHRGAPALPIGRGASGGELSRVMLAVEVCLAGTDPVPTLVFDEVDAGVGGRAAVEVGRRLARLAKHRQVLVVTHLAQVAAFADRHVVVDKPRAQGHGGVTASDVRVVTDDDRIAELARMLGGSDTATAREHAAELLADAAADQRATSRTSRRKAG